MDEAKLTTEQNILAAAEEVFLSKGYAAAKTTEIAKLAGVNHAMLHYYFRTKESLFNKVFDGKIKLFSNSFFSVFDQDLPFKEKLKLAINKHYDFLLENPRLPMFIIGEMLTSEERKAQVKEVLLPRLTNISANMQKAIDEEVSKGNMAPALAVDVVLNVISLNIFSVVFAQMISDKETYVGTNNIEEILKHRRENNVELILKGLGL